MGHEYIVEHDDTNLALGDSDGSRPGGAVGVAQRTGADFRAGLRSPELRVSSGKRHEDALRRVVELLKAGHVHVVDVDLQSYYDTIPRQPLLEQVVNVAKTSRRHRRDISTIIPDATRTEAK